MSSFSSSERQLFNAINHAPQTCRHEVPSESPPRFENMELSRFQQQTHDIGLHALVEPTTIQSSRPHAGPVLTGHITYGWNELKASKRPNPEYRAFLRSRPIDELVQMTHDAMLPEFKNMLERFDSAHQLPPRLLVDLAKDQECGDLAGSGLYLLVDPRYVYCGSSLDIKQRTKNHNSKMQILINGGELPEKIWSRPMYACFARHRQLPTAIRIADVDRFINDGIDKRLFLICLESVMISILRCFEQTNNGCHARQLTFCKSLQHPDLPQRPWIGLNRSLPCCQPRGGTRKSRISEVDHYAMERLSASLENSAQSLAARFGFLESLSSMIAATE